MKRYIALLLATCLLITCTACGKAATTDGSLSEEIVDSIIIGTTDQQAESTDTAESGEADKSQRTQKGAKTDKTQKGSKTAKGADTTDNTNSVSRTSRTRRTTTAVSRATVKTTAAPKTTTTTRKPTVKTTEDPAVYPKMSATVKELVNSGKLLAHGRAAVVGEELQMDWVNTGFELNGKLGGTLSIQAVNNREDTILNVVVDDNDPIEVHVPKGTNTVTLLSGLSKGPHVVKVINGTSLRLGTMAVKSISYEGELQKVSRTRLQIEVLGDSITCGWGIDGMSSMGYNYYNTNTKLAAISNSYYSYAAVAARRLDADLSVVALCAQTIPTIHSYFPTLNRRSGAPAWDFENNQMDIVVINLGTNDEFQNLGAAATLTNAKALLTDVRAKYPDAYIIWTFGMIRKTYAAQYKQAVNAMNDDKISYLDLSAYQNGDGFEAHPDREANALAGIALANYIEQNCK